MPFGDYKVKITVPEDHVVSGTGELKNSKDILSQKQLLVRKIFAVVHRYLVQK